jgi:hypothetical protein
MLKYAALLVVISATAMAQATYVGSAQCKTCHPQTYERWSKTRMANVVRNPQEHPEAMLGDLSKPDPAVNCKLSDIAWIYGSKWKQRYFTKRGDDYYPLGAQWDVQKQIWRPYKVAQGTDWWTAVYPDSNDQRPTGPLCDGCHSVNYNIQTKQVTEWNVGCEKCHGPGSLHVSTVAHEHRESRSARQYSGDQRLHAVSFRRPADQEPDQRHELGVGGRLRCREEPPGLLEAGRVQGRRAGFHLLRQRQRPQEPDAGE